MLNCYHFHILSCIFVFSFPTDEFKNYAKRKPEYAKLFTVYQEQVLGNGQLKTEASDEKAKSE